MVLKALGYKAFAVAGGFLRNGSAGCKLTEPLWYAGKSGVDVIEIDDGRDDENRNWIAGGGFTGC